MAKDPAVLLYTSDFLTGTLTLTDSQVGKYIRLLCLQHQKNGLLTEKDMINICKTYDEDIYSKFEKTEDGLFYNKRMKIEIDKRKSYTESRSKNRIGKFNKDKKAKKTYVKHMENENEDINIIYNSFITLFNEITNKNFRGTKKDQRQFHARIEEGFTIENFRNAITNCKNDKYHIENPHYLTPEFITRSDKLQKYMNVISFASQDKQPG